jgi:hypothetical protein
MGLTIAWALVLVPAVFYILLYANYRPILLARVQDIRGIMARGQTFQRYVSAFGASNQDDAAATLETLFYRSLGLKRFVFPVLVCAAAASAALLVLEVRSGFPMLPEEFGLRIKSLSGASTSALAGALLWGVYDAVQRFEAVELTPASLLYISLRLFLAPVIAPLVGDAFTESVKLLVAFGIGAFPVKTLIDFVKGRARTQLNIGAEETEKPTLQLLQGMTSDLLQLVQDQGFESVEHLAGADPVRLIFRINMPWKVILDLIDQSILVTYVGDKIARLRPLGIRGAIELATIQEDIDDPDPAKQTAVGQLVTAIAKAAEVDESGVRNMIQNAYEDVQVNLIWSFWGDEEIEEPDSQEAEPEEKKPS